MIKYANPENNLFKFFMPWRPIWELNPSLQPLIRELDALSSLRFIGNKVLPSIPKSLDKDSIKKIFTEMLLVSESKSNISIEQIQHWKAQLLPVLKLDYWGRWLHLEQAIQTASISGDLLFSALLLRSMGEETLRLLVLDFSENSTHINFKNSDSKCRAWVSGALIAIEPFVQSHESAVAPHTPKYFSLAIGEKASSKIKDCIKSLNDYVHPNFGSHILGCFPEESLGAEVILNSAIRIYSAFLSLNLTKEHKVSEGFSLPAPYLAEMSKLKWNIENKTLKRVNEQLRKNKTDTKLDVPSFFNRLNQENNFNQTEFEAYVDADFFNNLYNLVPCAQLPANKNKTEVLLDLIAKNQFPLRFRGIGILQTWSNVRRADTLLVDHKSNNSGPHKLGSLNWLKFIASALHLSICLSLFKIEMLIGQVAFQIASGNSLGAVFCARSLLEAIASIEWLMVRLDGSWDKIVEQVRQGKFCETDFENIDSDLAKFLTGTKSTLEQNRDWGDGWSVNGKESLGMLDLVKHAFSDRSDILKIYDITSAMVHGRLMRSVEILATETSTKNYITNFYRGLLVADYACDSQTQMHLKSRAIRMAHRLKSFESANGSFDGNENVLERITLSMDSLQCNVHYLGTGTKNDPISFFSGLPYYEGFNRYCAEFGLDPYKRQIEIVENNFLDAVENSGAIIYFRVPPVWVTM